MDWFQQRHESLEGVFDGLEELKAEREEIQDAIDAEEMELKELHDRLQWYSYQLAVCNERLASMVARKNNYDKNLRMTQIAFKKLSKTIKESVWELTEASEEIPEEYVDPDDQLAYEEGRPVLEPWRGDDDDSDEEGEP